MTTGPSILIPEDKGSQRGSLAWIENKTILTPTSGFLGAGYTHTINAYQGCAFAGAVCGIFCYAKHNRWLTRDRPWRLYGVKQHIREAYRRDYDRLKRPKRGETRPLKIYMSSSTDPYIPQERRLRVTQSLLAEMLDRPPDVLVIQSHNTLVARDLELIRQLSTLCELWVSLTVETDMEVVPGFPRHASPPARRIRTLRVFREAAVRTQATISPLMPLADPQRFAVNLAEACDRVILDHYLIGDGSPGGLRTKKTNFIDLLIRAGFSEWTDLRTFWVVRDIFAAILGPERVSISQKGFNSVGQHGDPRNRK